MNLKSIGQLAAASTVVVSLLLVAYELRQNRIIAQIAAYQSFVEGISQNDHFVASDPIVTPLIVRVNGGALPQDFTTEENFRLRSTYTGLLRLWEGLDRSVRAGILTEADLRQLGQGGAFANPYFRELWPDLREAFSGEFVESFEKLEWVTP